MKRRFCRTLLAAAAWWVITAARFAHAQEGAPATLLTNLQQMAALGADIPEGRYQARIQGVVTYVPGPNRVYLQNGELAAQVNLVSPTTRHRIGSLLEVTGTVIGGDPTLRLVNPKAVRLGDAPLPEANWSHPTGSSEAKMRFVT